jgi:hypothetical protein
MTEPTHWLTTKKSKTKNIPSSCPSLSLSLSLPSPYHSLSLSLSSHSSCTFLPYNHSSYHQRCFPGRDYTNYQWNPDTYGDPLTSALDRTNQARMPWHDIHMRVEGSAAIDISYNFIQRWNFAVRTGRNPGLAFPLSSSKLHDLYILPDFPSSVEDKGSCDCQILRSVCYWSAGGNFL